MAEILRATTSFSCGRAGIVRMGDLYESDDPIVKGREHLFEPVAGAVRVTAAVPGPVVSPPPAKRPPAKKAAKKT